MKHVRQVSEADSLKARLRDRTSPFQQHFFQQSTSTTSGATTNRQDSGDIGLRNLNKTRNGSNRWGSSTASHWNQSLKESIHTEIVRKPEYAEWKSEPKQMSVFQPMVFRLQIIQKQNEFLSAVEQRCRKNELSLVEALEAYRVVKDRLQLLTSNTASKLCRKHPAVLNRKVTIEKAIAYFTKLKASLAHTFQIPVSRQQSREHTMVLDKAPEKEVIVEKLDVWQEQEQPQSIPLFQFKLESLKQEYRQLNENVDLDIKKAQAMQVEKDDQRKPTKKEKCRQSTDETTKISKKSDIPRTSGAQPEMKNTRFRGRTPFKGNMSKTLVVERTNKSRKSSQLPGLALVMEEIQFQHGDEGNSEMDYETEDRLEYAAMTPTKSARKKKMKDFSGYFMNTFTPGQVEHLRQLGQLDRKRKRMTMQGRESSDYKRVRRAESAELSQFVRKNDKFERPSQELLRLTGQFNQFNRSSRLTRRKHVFFKGPTPEGSSKFMEAEALETPSHIIETAEGKKIDLRTINFENLLTNVNVKKRVHKVPEIAKIELVLEDTEPAAEQVEDTDDTLNAIHEAVKVILDPNTSFVKNRDTIVKECQNLSRVLGQNDEQTIKLQKMLGKDEKKAVDFIIKKIKNSEKLQDDSPFEIIDEIKGAVAANELYGHRVLQLMQHFVRCRIVRRVTTENEQNTSQIGILPTEIRTKKVDVSRCRYKMESKLLDLINVIPVKFDEEILQQHGLRSGTEKP